MEEKSREQETSAREISLIRELAQIYVKLFTCKYSIYGFLSWFIIFFIFS